MTEGIYTNAVGHKCRLFGIATDTRNGDHLAIYHNLGDKNILIRNAEDFDPQSTSRIYKFYSPVRRRTGKWYRIGGCLIVQCSLCRKLAHDATEFCPHCGEPMSKGVVYDER